ncbi:MAG: hypothetical protein AB7U59_01610 [Desulfovibrionaceae bacterium]
MSDKLDLLEQALATGERELHCLLAGEIEEAEKLAKERGQLLEMAWGETDPESVGLLRDKLLKLKSLQGQLTTEARRLHAELKSDLQRAKQENQRLSGYRSTVRPNPAVSRYLDKAG